MTDTAAAILLTKKATAQALQISLRGLSRLEAAGKIGPRPVKLGGSVRYNATELAEWAAAGQNGELPRRQEWLERQNATQ